MSLPEEERPPVFKTWRTWYVLTIAFLLAQIVGYYLLTQLA